MSCETSAQWEVALLLLREMSETGVQANSVSYNSCLAALAGAGEWERASALLEEMPSASGGRVRPDLKSHTSVVTACVKAGAWVAALDVVRTMWAEGIPPDAKVFLTVFEALDDAGRGGDEALSLVRETTQGGTTTSAAVAAGGGGGGGGAGGGLAPTPPERFVGSVSAQDAAATVALMGGDLHSTGGGGEGGVPLAPPEAFFRGVIQALVQRNDAVRAAALVREMAGTEGCSPAPADFNRVINACGGAGRWEESVALLREMGPAGASPNALSYEGE